MGWGIAKNIQYDNGKRGDVPYWHCRNSWGESWGDNGYFKIAMYPFNKRAQFEKTFLSYLKSKKKGIEPHRFGGIILFKATREPKVYRLPKIHDNYKKSIVPTQDPSFYRFEVDVGDQTSIPVKTHAFRRKNNTYHTLIVIGIIILILVIVSKITR